jgi:hypothetical protein
MNHNRKPLSTIISTIILLAVAIISMSCSSGKVAGTEVGNEFVAITVYEPNGTTPAANATVEIYSSDDSSHIPVQSTTTDDDGQYKLGEDLSEDTYYNIYCKSDALVSFQDSILITSGVISATDDTLSAARTISGVVDVQVSGDAESVTVHLLGTPIKADVDANGHFTLANVATGDYSVLCVSSAALNEESLVEPIALSFELEISSETPDTLVDTLQLPVSEDKIDIEFLTLTPREHGYSNFETTVIKSEEELNSLINEFIGQPNWNEKESILGEIREWDIDFDTSYVVFYRHTEGSGSIEVSVEEPILEGSIPTINILRDVPEEGTDDMAYYCYAFKVNRNYSEIMIDSNTITIADSSDVDDTLPVLDTMSITQKYLFEYYHSNYAWVYQLTGTYIDNHGNIISYNHSGDEWLPQNSDTLSQEELDDKYSLGADTIGVVDEETLEEMFGLLDAVEKGEYSERVNVMADGGQFVYVIYRYDEVTDKYVRVLLKEYGDSEQNNLAGEADTLYQWLKSVMPSN